MIRVHRGEEPPALTRARERRLAELRLRWLDEGIRLDDVERVAAFADEHGASLDKDYREHARELLLLRTHSKCAYCEAEILAANDIDHFRPRRPAPGRDDRRAGKTLVHPGYFWLTWSWDNLLFVCATCHGPKSNAFEVSGQRMAPWTNALDVEPSSLLDPAREDPVPQLAFKQDHNGRWVVHGKGPRAEHTVGAFNLGVNKDRYKEHSASLDHSLEELRLAEQAHGAASTEFDRQWRRLVRHFIDRKETRFRAFSRAYIAHHLAGLMATHSLTLPALTDASPAPAPIPLFRPRPELNGLDERLAMSIRALNPKNRTQSAKDRILLAYVAAGGGPLDALLSLCPDLARTPPESAALEQRIQALAAQGALSWDGAALTQTTEQLIEQALDELISS